MTSLQIGRKVSTVKGSRPYHPEGLEDGALRLSDHLWIAALASLQRWTLEGIGTSVLSRQAPKDCLASQKMLECYQPRHLLED